MSEMFGEIKIILNEVTRLAKIDKKFTGFCIGNTRKIDSKGFYFSPIRETSRLISGSVVVYEVNQAIEVARAVDGKVDFILIDTEKKISPELYGDDNVGNVERAVRETVKQSQILTYKGNDLTVDSIENLIVHLLSSGIRGLGGKKAAIIGAGNVGSKLALKLVERGMNVSLVRRDRFKLDAIVTALNIIKPKETIATISAGIDNFSAAQDSNLLIGLTQGTPVITKAMIDILAPGAILIDGGKGCFEQDAIEFSKEKDMLIYRADIRPGFEGHMAMIFKTEDIFKYESGRSEIEGIAVISGGILGQLNDIVVDSVIEPHFVFGVANGMGDFVRVLNEDQSQRLQAVQNYIKRKQLI